MSIQERSDIDTNPFILYTFPASRQDDAIVAQDGARATPLAAYTLMAKIAASGKWVPFTSEVATDGSAIPQGIYVPGDKNDSIAAADIVAGDVADVPIVTFGIKANQNLLVIENSKTLATVIATSNAAAVYYKKSVRDILKEQSIIFVQTESISAQENV